MVELPTNLEVHAIRDLAKTFGSQGRIVLPLKNLHPVRSGMFLGEVYSMTNYVQEGGLTLARRSMLRN